MSIRMVFLACDFLRSTFANERVFQVVVSDGRDYIGLAAIHYCYKSDGERLGEDEPEANVTIDGKLAARVVRNGTGKVYVAVPDGEIISVPCKALSERSPNTP